MAVIIPNPTSASGIIVLLKCPQNIENFFPTLFVKTTYYQLVFDFEQMCTVTIFAEHGMMALIIHSKYFPNSDWLKTHA